MNETVTSITTFQSDNFSIKQIYTSQFWKLAAGALLLTSLVACATVPSESADSDVPPPDMGLTFANVMYNTRNYTGAVREFDTIITDAEASANSRRRDRIPPATPGSAAPPQHDSRSRAAAAPHVDHSTEAVLRT